jgi:DNA-binding CsgD family transcriptional regulator
MLRQELTTKYHCSSREAEVVEHVIKGQTNQEVADKLFVTEKTVKFHLTNIYRKVEVKSRAQLIVKFIGLLPKGHEPIIEEAPAPKPELPVGQAA